MQSIHIISFKSISLPKTSAEALISLLADSYQFDFITKEAVYAAQDLTAYVLGYENWGDLKKQTSQKKLDTDYSKNDENCLIKEFKSRRTFQEKRFVDGLKILEPHLPSYPLISKLAYEAKQIIDQWQPSAAVRYTSAKFSVERAKYKTLKVHLKGAALSEKIVNQIVLNQHFSISKSEVQQLIDSAVVFGEYGLNPHNSVNSSRVYKTYIENCGVIATWLLNQINSPVNQLLGRKLIEFLSFQAEHPYSNLQLARFLSETWAEPSLKSNEYYKNRFNRAYAAIENAQRLFKIDQSRTFVERNTVIEICSTRSRICLLLPKDNDKKPTYKDILTTFSEWAAVSPIGIFYLGMLHSAFTDTPLEIEIIANLKMYLGESEQANQPTVAANYFKEFLEKDINSIDADIKYLKEIWHLPENVSSLDFINIAKTAL